MKKKIFAAAVVTACLLSAPAEAGSSFSLGLEGFYDHYVEPAGVVTDNTPYGSVTAGYVYNSSPTGFFTALDLRGSYGTDHYSATGNGTSSGSPQYEGEARWRLGENLYNLAGGGFSVYTGAGARGYYDKSKGTVTTLGFAGYDRRILQFYVPVGITWRFGFASWIAEPTAEYDQFIWGHVNSRQQNAGGFNISNVQHSGYGLRGDFMMKPGPNSRWEIGPFVRYWNVNDSDVYTDQTNAQWIEPHNTRLQTGLAIKYIF